MRQFLLQERQSPKLEVLAVLARCSEPGVVSASRPLPTGRFSGTDLAWEQVQEGGLRAFGAGRDSLAAEHWQRGLAIAHGRFGPDDPRLATSLTNAALMLRRRGDFQQAGRHFRNAGVVWDRAIRWVRLMTPPGGTDGGYDEAAMARFEALIAQGKAASLAIESLGTLPPWGLDGWRSVRPRRGSDLRKLLAAVFLIASRGR